MKCIHWARLTTAAQILPWIAAIVVALGAPAGCQTANTRSAPRQADEAPGKPRAQKLAPKPAPFGPFIWHVRKGGRINYLLGSVHIGTKAMYPLPKAMEDAYAKASVVAFEVDAENTMNSAGLVMQLGLAESGKTLSTYLSDDGNKELSAAAAKRQLPMPTLERMRPWLAAVTVMAGDIKKSGGDEKLGIDRHFLKRTKQDKTRLVELETIAFQVRLFASMSAKQQEAMLLHAVGDGAIEEMKRTLEIWRRGDLAALDELVSAFENEPDWKDAYEALLTRRNAGMMRKIDALFGKPQTALIIVGAAHMVGKQGLIALLKKRGYDVKRAKVIR